MSDFGLVFPPRTASEIDAYPIGDVVAGYMDQESDDPVSGPNHAPGYRWGWQNRVRDRQHGDDGFDALRFANIKANRDEELRAKGGAGG